MDDRELYDLVVAEIGGNDEPMSVIEIADTLGVDSCDVLRAIESNSQKFVLDIENYDPRVGPKVHLKEAVRKMLGDPEITVNDGPEEADPVARDVKHVITESISEIVEDVVQSVFFRLACEKVLNGLSDLAEFVVPMGQDEVHQRIALAHLETALASTQEFISMFDDKEGD